MKPGRESRSLGSGTIERLKRFQRAKRYSVEQLKLAMAAPFKYQTLQRALRGEPIWILNYEFIADWCDRYIPNGDALPFESKRAAAGERDEELGQSVGEGEPGDAAPARLRSES